MPRHALVGEASPGKAASEAELRSNTPRLIPPGKQTNKQTNFRSVSEPNWIVIGPEYVYLRFIRGASFVDRLTAGISLGLKVVTGAMGDFPMWVANLPGRGNGQTPATNV